MKKKLAAGILSVVLVTGGAMAVHASVSQAAEPQVKAQEQRSMLTEEQAKQIALNKKHIPGAEVTSVELQQQDNFQYYKVHLERDRLGFDVYLNAYTGNILKVVKYWDGVSYGDPKIDFVKYKDNPDRYYNYHYKKDDDVAKMTPSLSAEQAAEIVKSQISGAVITEIELDEEDNRLVYEIEVIADYNEADVTIDASTGKVLSIDWDDDDYDDDHDDDHDDDYDLD
ncbi:PepSY domain-containing protein [Paenibacillus sp. 32O-W]|uniref:PepSY domain-containing protein n=1 Tax=Paenibacillus sp. 32O-W TaxID=1695218 RepID=UPI0011A6F501|nr:PepSY domain-containing protein [Paenibacillus sp. 32O-W]